MASKQNPMDRPVSQGNQPNPYAVKVKETLKPDNSRQVNLVSDQGGVQVTQGADGNNTITTTRTMDFSPGMFTSLQPAAAAMDQIFGTRMAGAMPSQREQLQNLRMAQGQEADPMADLKRRLMEAQIGSMERKAEPSLREALQVKKLEADIALKGAQTKKAKEEAELRKKQTTGEIALKDWQLEGEVLPKPSDTAKLRKNIGTAKELASAVDKLSALVREQGTMPNNPESWAEMRRLHTRITTALKNEEELGALTGPDLPLLLREIGAVPGTKEALMTPNSTYLKGLETLKGEVFSRVDKRVREFGYTPKQGTDPFAYNGGKSQGGSQAAKLKRYQELLKKQQAVGGR